MANISQDVNINVKSNLEEQNKQAVRLKDTLEAAGKTRITSAVSAAKQGVEATNAAKELKKLNDSRESGLSRSLGAGTGAEGRDFAKQAQGLGGLVHVYATFAANIFAVSAAFTALSKAADTTNLVRGLDQLGSFSGRALGSVAKQLSMVTDGAISLRDAMTATAQASAGGMTNSTILRMGAVAKQASQALGVAMPDALSRLSRGITKIEPELLDEIGIMVRIDTASQNYARTLGKTASSLTDFEKRQGFANAVLEQGEKKFGALKLDANPYAKISASMANIAQTGLELINLVLKPIVSLLSSSPVALAGAMGLIATALLKQALPALGMFKENMQAAADQARNIALTRAVEAQKGYKAEFVASKIAAVAKAKSDYALAVSNAEAVAEAKVDALDKAETKIKALREKSKKGSVAEALLSKDLHEISAKDIAKLDANASQLESKALKQALAGNTEKAESLMKASESQKEYANAIRSAQKTEAEYFSKNKQAIADREEALNKVNISEETAAKAALTRRSLLDTDRQTQIIADRALLKSASQTIVSQAAQTAAVRGYSEAVKEAKEAVAKARSGPTTKLMDLGNTEVDAMGKTISKLDEVTTPAMGRMQGHWTIMKTRITAATSAVGTFMNAFGVWSFVLGAVVAGFGLLDSWLTKTEKEMTAANNALGILGDSLTNIDRVISNINGYGSIEIISSATLQASANAVNDLSDNLDRGLKSALAYKAKVGFFDSILEGWKMMFGISIPDKVAKNITESINKILQLAQPGPEVDKFKEKLSQILKIDPNDTEALNKALTLGNIEDKGPLVVKAIQEISAEMVKLGSKSKAVDDAFAVSSKAYDTVTASLSPSDNLAKLGFSMIDLGSKMSEAFSSPVTALSQLAAISDDVSKLRFFDEKTASGFIKESANIKETSNALVVYSKRLSDIKTESEQLAIEVAKADKINNPQEYQKTNIKRDKKDQLNLDAEYLTEVVNSLKSKMKPFLDSLVKGVDASFIKGATLVANSIGIEFAKSGIIVSKALSEGLGNTLGAINQKARLDTESIDLQIRQINTTIDLIKSNEKLIALQEEDSLRKQRDALAKDGLVSGSENLAKYDELGKRIAAAVYRREVGFSNMKEVTSGLKGEINKPQETSREKIERLNKGSVSLVNPEIVKIAAQGSLAAAQQQEASKANMASLNAQKEAIAIDKKFKIMTELNNIEKDNLTTKQYSLNVTKAELEALSSNALYLSQETTARKNALTEQQALNAAQLANKDITLEREKAVKVLNSYAKGSVGYAEAQLAIDQIDKKQSNKTARDKEDSLIRQIGYQQALLSARQAEVNFQVGLIKQREDAANLERNTQISIAEETQARFTAIGAYTDEEIAKLNTKLAIEKEIQRSKEAQSNLALNIASEQTSLGLKLATIPTGDNPERKAIEEKMAANAAAYTQAIEGETRLTAAKQATIQVQGAMTALQAKQTEDMTKMVSITESLSTIFGTLGESIGKAGEAMLKLTQENEKYAATEKERVALSDTIKDPGASAKDKLDATNKLAKLEKDHTKAELSNITSVAGASKKFFNEKSAGYKLLNNIEKASSAMSMALQLKDLATSLGILTTKVTAEGAAETSILGIKVATAPAKVAADAPGILSSFGQLGPIGYAVGAAIVASLLSMVGGSGGGTQVDMTGLTSADRQATQGTGQSWVNGAKTDTGGGVFGDSEAKSTAIVSSLAIMRENSIEGLHYDNKMLKALEKLADSVTGAAKSLYSVPGLRQGTNFGTKEGTTSNAAFDIGIPLIGGLVDKVLGGLFGGDTSQSSSITSAGIQFKGTFQNVIDDVSGSILQYKDVLTQFHEGGGWFGSDKDWSELNRQTSKLKSEVQTSLGDIFRDANSLFAELGNKVGISAESIKGVLRSFDVSSLSIDIKGLSGQALIDELNAVIGNGLSDVAKRIFGGFDQFKNFGEDYLTTVIRVVDSSDKVNQALKSIGSSFEIIGKFDISETMIKAAGSLTNFMDQASFFRDNFLSAKDKLAPIQYSVTKELTRLGISTNITKDQFKNLVVGLNLSTDAGRLMYQSLMELAPGFNTMIELTDSLKSSNKEASDAIKNQQLKILNLLSKTEEALALTRSMELETIKDALKPTQLYIYALEDEMAIKDKLKAAYEKESTAIKGTISSLTTSIKTLETYKNALKIGANSVLTPSDKYALNKQNLTNTAQKASAVITSASTPEEIAARDAALSSLSSVSDTFLASSRELFASSAQYTADFNSVLAILDMTGANLTSQQSNAEKQLAALDSSVSFLDIISKNTDTTATLLKQYLEKQALSEKAKSAITTTTSAETSSVVPVTGSTTPWNIDTTPIVVPKAYHGTVKPPGYASGGLASGVSMVGEHGPELVDFATPARVYSTSASNGLLNNKELIEEIKNLRKEVVQLRKEQQQQTGYIVSTNYDANNKAAEKVVSATEDTAVVNAWTQRSIPKIA